MVRRPFSEKRKECSPLFPDQAIREWSFPAISGGGGNHVHKVMSAGRMGTNFDSALKNSAIPMAARQAPVSELLIFAVPIAMGGIPIAMGAIRIAMDSTRRSNYCKGRSMRL